jgi:TetR/AcrR family transcriptional regulator, transcriptional repressor for nem operon
MHSSEHSRRRKPAESRAEVKEQTREALIDAASALFGKEGLDGPSLDAICARAGFTRGAFYVHFHSREELIVAVMERIRARVIATLIATRQGPLDLERTIALFAGAVAAGSYPPKGGAVKLQHFLDACARSPLIRKRHVQLLHDTQKRLADAAHTGQSAAKIRGDVAPEIVALLLMALVMGVEQMLEVGFDFDIHAGAAGTLKLLRPR